MFNYKYLPFSGDPKEKLNGKNCLVISDWTNVSNNKYYTIIIIWIILLICFFILINILYLLCRILMKDTQTALLMLKDLNN